MKKYIQRITAVFVAVSTAVITVAASPVERETELSGSESGAEGVNIVERWTKRDKIKLSTIQQRDSLDELVIVGKDTISIILPERNYGRYDRGLYNFLFIPKGKWQIGLTASYGEFDVSDYQVLDLISDIDFRLKGYSVNPELSYFFKHNQALGLRFDLTKYEGGIDGLKADIDDDMNFNLWGVNYKSTTYSMAAFYRHYLGLGKGGRFGLFNEVAFKLGGGDSYFTRNYDGLPKLTRTNIFQFGLDFSPGVCVFVQEYVSFNVSFGVFGLNMRKERQWTDGIEDGTRFTSGANFRFNLFNIKFGMGIHI